MTAEKLGTGVTNYSFRHKEHMMEAVNGQLDERYWKSDDAAQECHEFRCDMAARGGLVGLSNAETRTMKETKRLLAKRRHLLQKYREQKRKRKGGTGSKGATAKVNPER
mmetsp:Transcript_36164/g.62588  ORF Transcript_36164/g.62588 Transcript_36164/m.62588 type:complete len:109 (-) Transcript_36164:539-865(-)